MESDVKLVEMVAAADCLPHGPGIRLIDGAVIDKDRATAQMLPLAGRTLVLSDHFPGQPVTPGCLVIEALAQTAICLVAGRPELLDSLFLLRTVEAKFRKPLDQTDTPTLLVQLERLRPKHGVVRGLVYLGKDQIASVKIVFAITPKKA